MARVFIDPSKTEDYVPRSLRDRPVPKLTNESSSEDRELARAIEESNARKQRERITFKLKILTARQDAHRRDQVRFADDDGMLQSRAGTWTHSTLYYGLAGWTLPEGTKTFKYSELNGAQPPAGAFPVFEVDAVGCVREELLDYIQKDVRYELARAIEELQEAGEDELFD